MRLILILLAAVAVSGCGSGSSAGAPGKTSVVAAFYPLSFAAEEIGGDGVDVTNMTPPGAEPHDVELSVRDVEKVRSADVVLYLGNGFQPSVERAVDGAEGESIDLLDGLAVRDRDPHVWLDPVRYEEIVHRIGEALERPAAAKGFSHRVERLDQEFRRGLAHCERHEIVTSHEAFGYLAARYGLEQIAITGVSPESEPTPRTLERVIDEVRASGATTVFSEPLVSSRIADTVARETGTRTAVLNPLEGLTDDELDRGEDYFSVMRENLAALRRALGCP
ncbi:MAG TPA: zinc ABC transporter substrate-binding protein [Gaiellaceae bacterium]|jgi:zinc transport system substrate-binding protein|nr:zinc ABC transporter substrate-binding protein [Gaiellaceae bacterium]